MTKQQDFHMRPIRERCQGIPGVIKTSLLFSPFVFVLGTSIRLLFKLLTV